MSKETLFIELLHPKSFTVIKRYKQEQLVIQLKITSSQPLVPENLIVEAWSSVFDDAGKQKTAFPLMCSEVGTDYLIYTTTLALPYTGYFPFRFRARFTHHNYWQWAEINGTKDLVNLWVDPNWMQSAIVYNAFVRYFGAKAVDEDGVIKQGEGGKFSDVRKELDKLKGLGIKVLYLNPVHLIGELYKNYNPHDLLPSYLQPGCPYSVKDYKSIDTELAVGKDPVKNKEHPFLEFRKLVDYAHKLGIRVIMDMVFNHSAHDSVFQRIHPEWFLYKEDICSLEEPYIHPDEVKEGKPWGDPKHTFAPNDHGYWWTDTAQLNWNNIEDYPDFIMKHTSANKAPKNPTIKDMYEYFKNITKYWVKEFGIDGFRCDVAYRVPVDFWKECIIETRQVAKESYPKNGSLDGDVVFIAEDYHVMMKELFEAGFLACYGDFSNKLQTVQDIKGYLDYMYNMSGDYFPEGSKWFIFPECHDFHRNPTKIVQEERRYHEDADLNANKTRWVLTATLPGIPMIFNGFEKMEWEPADLFSYSSIDWESDKDITEYIRRVNKIRNTSIALQKGSYSFIPTKEGEGRDAKIFSFARTYEGEVIIVAVNMDVLDSFGTELFLPDDLPIDYSQSYEITDLLTDKTYKRKGQSFTVLLEAGESQIFKVRQ